MQECTNCGAENLWTDWLQIKSEKCYSMKQS